MNGKLIATQDINLFGFEASVYGTVDEPLFDAIEVAQEIGYTLEEVEEMIDMIDEDEKSFTDDMWFITEDGLYEALMLSRSEVAKHFKNAVKMALKKMRRQNNKGVEVRRNNNLSIEGAKLLFKNFEGREERFNEVGRRNFNVIIDDQEVADRLKLDGWNVRTLSARDEDDEDEYTLKVNVNFSGRVPPKVIMVTNDGVQTRLDEETIGLLDNAYITNADVSISPHEYDTGKYSAYLQTLYVTVEDMDEFAYKYK